MPRSKGRWADTDTDHNCKQESVPISRHTGCNPEGEANCQRVAVAMGVSRYLCGETSHNETSVQLSGPASGSMSRTLNRISQRRNWLCYRRSLPGSTEDTYRSEQLVLPVCCP